MAKSRRRKRARPRISDEREAEELRAGIEHLCTEADRSVDFDRDELVVPVHELERLLDDVDARDSLAYLERKERMRRAREKAA